MRDAHLEARFWSKVRRSEGCWEWTAARNPMSGYGVFRIGRKSAGTGRTETAHRMAWLLTNWIIPNGKHVLHRCDNRRCVRPDHLFLGTHVENVADMIAKGRHQNGYTLNPPERCKRGHEFTQSNTALDDHGNRRCRQCARMWARIYRQRAAA